ncbi:Cytochrome P450 [Glarea lozoyensis ATCC 20868]|uniref:Cytochrome P450 n=1 Tax=Glarea lozoyensis (strain ATCC 20868 / MF5171) TaxID=1116229 RepID=S3CKD1_GLAL2|nr:Cytochrome P450 [Glarea lozoyensis ATCC 20868]EPE26982.1 Cytochrome P450 [Glarea lozoyensis ATCC 20868]
MGDFAPEYDEPKRYLLIGVGPHAKRIYIPHLNELEKEGRARLVCAVDCQGNEQIITEYRDRICASVELAFVPFFTDGMPKSVSEQLSALAHRLRVSCVIISTEPLAHKAYGLWAVSQGFNVIMDKPITTQKGVTTSVEQAYKIAEDYDDLAKAYSELQQRNETMFLISSHRRYHPGLYCTFDMLREVTDRVDCPVTNIISTHCDGMWRLPSEMVDQKYHTFNTGYGKVSHSGYHFLDMVYRFLKSGWTEEKKPDKIEVVSSFMMPNGFQKCFNHEDYKKAFGAETYAKVSKYSDEELEKLMATFGEVDAALQITFIKNNEPICLAQVNLQHNGFSRRSWVTPGADLYKGIGRVKHEFHEIKSGPFQTIVVDSRQANDKHDRSKPSTAKIGTDNHFEVHVFRNSELLGEEKPLVSYSVAELDKRYDSKLPGIYSENVKRGILWEATDFLEGKKNCSELASNLDDHSVPAHIMSAVYVSHVRRISGLNPVVSIDLTYTAKVSPNKGTATASIRGGLEILAKKAPVKAATEVYEIPIDVLSPPRKRALSDAKICQTQRYSDVTHMTIQIWRYLRLRRLQTPQVDVPVINLGADRNFDDAHEKYLYHFKDLLQEGYQKSKHGVYQVWSLDGYILIVTPDLVEELNALGTEVLDFHAASQRRVIGEYEWLKITDSMEAHTILTDLTRQIGTILPSINKEIEYAMECEFPKCQDWTPLAVHPKMLRIMSLVVSLMIVGPTLSRNEEWLMTMAKFVEGIFIAGWELKKYSQFVRPLISRGLVPGVRGVWKQQAVARRLLIPMIRSRRAAEAHAQATGSKYQKPNDMVQWLMDNGAKASPTRTDKNLAELCLVVVFAALHAATQTLVNIVLDLAAHQEYVDQIREEYRTARAKYSGLDDKQALLVNSLSKLDSFMKESQRLNPATLTSFSRLVRRPVTLSTGLHLPAGTHILVPAAMVSLDPVLYPSPNEFRGFRFHEKRASATTADDAHKDQFTTTSPRTMHFGYGRQACPGRFFASAAIKSILVHLLEEFDLRLIDPSAGRPKNMIKGGMNLPSETVELMFRRRK